MDMPRANCNYRWRVGYQIEALHSVFSPVFSPALSDPGPELVVMPTELGRITGFSDRYLSVNGYRRAAGGVRPDDTLSCKSGMLWKLILLAQLAAR